MAVLTAQEIGRGGLEVSLASADAAGDSVANAGRTFFRVDNGGGGSITVSLTIEETVDGQAVTARTVAVPAGESRVIGPFPVAEYNDTNSRAGITYSGVTSVTVAAITLPER